MIKFLKLCSNSVKSVLFMNFTYTVGGSLMYKGKHFRRLVCGCSIIYDIVTSVIHREKTSKFSYYSHFLTMNILKNAILNMNIFTLRKFKPRKQSGNAKNLCKYLRKKSVFTLRKDNVEIALKSQKSFVDPTEKKVDSS